MIQYIRVLVTSSIAGGFFVQVKENVDNWPFIERILGFIQKGIVTLRQTLFSNPFIFATQCNGPKIFYCVNSVRSNKSKFKILKAYTIRLKWSRD